MEKVSFEKLQDSVDKIAHYLATEVPRRDEVATKEDPYQKADKTDVKKIEDKIDIILNGMDKQGQQYYTNGAGCF